MAALAILGGCVAIFVVNAAIGLAAPLPGEPIRWWTSTQPNDVARRVRMLVAAPLLLPARLTRRRTAA